MHTIKTRHSSRSTVPGSVGKCMSSGHSSVSAGLNLCSLGLLSFFPVSILMSTQCLRIGEVSAAELALILSIVETRIAIFISLLMIMRRL